MQIISLAAIILATMAERLSAYSKFRQTGWISGLSNPGIFWIFYFIFLQNLLRPYWSSWVQYYIMYLCVLFFRYHIYMNNISMDMSHNKWTCWNDSIDCNPPAMLGHGFAENISEHLKLYIPSSSLGLFFFNLQLSFIHSKSQRREKSGCEFHKYLVQARKKKKFLRDYIWASPHFHRNHKQWAPWPHKVFLYSARDKLCNTVLLIPLYYIVTPGIWVQIYWYKSIFSPNNITLQDVSDKQKTKQNGASPMISSLGGDTAEIGVNEPTSAETRCVTQILFC